MSRLPELLHSPNFLRTRDNVGPHFTDAPGLRSISAVLRELWVRGTHVTRADHTDVSCPKCVRAARESAARCKTNWEAVRSLV